MKKFLALALSSVLALSLLAGCGSSNTPAASGSSTSGSASTGTLDVSTIAKNAMPMIVYFLIALLLITFIPQISLCLL